MFLPVPQVIPAQGSSTVHVSFTPLTTSCESKCVGLALAFISLDSKVNALSDEIQL